MLHGKGIQIPMRNTYVLMKGRWGCEPMFIEVSHMLCNPLFLAEFFAAMNVARIKPRSVINGKQWASTSREWYNWPQGYGITGRQEGDRVVIERITTTLPAYETIALRKPVATVKCMGSSFLR